MKDVAREDGQQCRKPPSAGPMITASVKAVELRAMAFASESGWTRNGNNDWREGSEKPRAAPNTARMM